MGLNDSTACGEKVTCQAFKTSWQLRVTSLPRKSWRCYPSISNTAGAEGGESVWNPICRLVPHLRGETRSLELFFLGFWLSQNPGEHPSSKRIWQLFRPSA